MPLVVALVLLLAALAAPVVAEFPYPSNPRPCADPPAPDCIPATDFHRYLALPASEPPLLPNDFRNNWKLTSERTGDPLLDNNPQELFGVKGASVDRAWQVTTGRPDVLIAVLDSGIRWGERLPDLVNKFYLNRGELPVPEGSTNPNDAHDRNRDGVFNVRDYLDGDGVAQDSRVADDNGNGMIDPEDLIFAFTDGVDDDSNGYADDISGWDFWEDDNNPLDEVRYGHGTGESHDSAAEANNGTDNPGTCPNCMLLEVRVGDSFVAEVSDFAQGVLFATDSGAQIVQEALGTVNNSAFAQQAIDYAYRRGTVIMASAADEESRHNNFPAAYRNTLVVNSVTLFFDQSGFTQSPPSYLYLNGCTNFSGHIGVAVPSEACSSEATGLSSGMAGLVLSAALDGIDRGTLTPYPTDDGFAPFALSAEEIKQLFTMSADDINFDARPDLEPPLPQNYTSAIPLPGITQQTSRYPSIAGFDQYFGYGRINADSAVRRVADGRIPPEASILEPGWFAYLQPKQETIALTGRVAARRAESFRYTVEVAGGVQPAEGAFVTVHESEPISGELDGTLAQLDLDRVAGLMPFGVSGPSIVDDGSGRGDPDRFTFTVRVRVLDDRGLVGEDRRTLFLHEDPQLVESFPQFLGSDGGAAPRSADLDGDGVEELILATSNGEVHAMRLGDAEVPGWPVTTDPIEVHSGSAAYQSGEIDPPNTAILGDVAIGDLEGDGALEVVATDVKGKVYVWSAAGERRSGFPVSTLAEYSNARRSERDLGTEAGLLPDKTNRKSEHNRLGRGFAGGPTLANLDGSADGSLEILAGAMDRHIYAWYADGAPVPGWPAMLRDPTRVASVDAVTNEVVMKADARTVMGSKIIRSPAVGDLDGDGDLEVVSGVNEGYEGLPNAIFDGLVTNLMVTAGLLNPGNTRVYALHHDGTQHGSTPLAHGWNPDAFAPGWPVSLALLQTEILPVVGTGSNGPPVLADLDGDGKPEVVTFSAVGPLYLLRGDGSSFLGMNRGRPVVLQQMPFGIDSNSADAPTFGALGGPAVAPLGGADAPLDIIAPTSGLGRLVDTALPAQQTPADNHISAWSSDGKLLAAFPRETSDLQFFVVPVIADITGDGKPEILQGSGVRDLHAVDADGIEAPGFPKLTAGWTVAPPAVADFDGDGKLEVAHVTREGYLFVWKTEGDVCGFQPWRQARHDEHGTSNIAVDARPPATVRSAQLHHAESGVAVFELNLMPGDDLICGAAATLDVRHANQPILDVAAFEAATPVAAVANGPAGRESVQITLSDASFAGRQLYFALRAADDAGNRSGLTVLGAVTFPAAATATPTVTETATPTQTPTATPSPLPSATPSPSPTSTHTPTSTPTVDSGDDGDGCAIASNGAPSSGVWLLGLFGVAIATVRRHRGKDCQ